MWCACIYVREYHLNWRRNTSHGLVAFYDKMLLSTL